MKPTVTIICLMLTSMTIQAQIKLDRIVERSTQKAQKQVENRIEKRIDKGVNKTLDSVEDEIDGKNKTADPEKKSAKPDEPSDNNQAQEQTPTPNISSSTSQSQPPTLTWSNYDFIPGTDIIFSDDLLNEKNGEFPSKWDLVAGTAENAAFDDENILYIIETGNFPNGIVPLVKNSQSDYLPDEFTVEFDCYFEKGKYGSYRLFFYDAKNQKRINYLFIDIYVNNLRFGQGSIEKQYPNTQFGNTDKQKSQWRHIAISFNKRALKVYMDDTRLLNIPNVTENPTGITIGANHARPENKQMLKNIRIAQGAVPLYDKLLTDGKFVTTGIVFDINKASIKPESMGTLNYVVKMMTDFPELKFRIEGHTDSDGEETSNQLLSEQRAMAVKNKMIQLGISANRLDAKGYGESKPLNNNSSAEDKAKNRRVEFVKF
jgi:OmpA-OmpF porin, OOP family